MFHLCLLFYFHLGVDNTLSSLCHNVCWTFLSFLNPLPHPTSPPHAPLNLQALLQWRFITRWEFNDKFYNHVESMQIILQFIKVDMNNAYMSYYSSYSWTYFIILHVHHMFVQLILEYSRYMHRLGAKIKLKIIGMSIVSIQITF